MNRDEVISKIHDHETRIRMLEIGAARTMVYAGIVIAIANVAVTVVLKLMFK